MLKKIISLVFISCVIAANAAPVARQGNQSVTLGEGACPEKIMNLLRERGVPAEFVQHSGEAMIGGKHFNTCWTLLPDGRVGIIYEDGDMGSVPQQAFRDEPGA